MESKNKKATEPGLYALTSRVLWLGAIILTMLAATLIWIGLAYPGALWAAVAIGFGVNFFTGAVGAALYEILIRRPQRERREEITRSDITAVQAAIDGASHDISVLRDHLGEISTFVEKQSKAASLEEAQIAEMFATRVLAAQSMTETVLQADLSEVRILGISLGDFLSGSYGSPWWHLRRYVTGEIPVPGATDALSVKILVCDPKSLGAHLVNIASTESSSSAVSLRDEEEKSPLEADFDFVFSRLRPLLDQAEQAAQRRPKLELRICRELPASFMFAANRTTFVQPHVLQPQQAMKQLVMPVLKYDPTSSISAALVHQFDILWKYAAAPPDNLIDGKPVRIDGGAARSGVVELYTNADRARLQLEHLLRSAKQRVLLQGISNVPIMRGELSEAFIEAVTRPDVAVRVLILDPKSIAAKQKTFARYESMGDQRAAGGWQAYNTVPASRDAPHQSSEIYHNIRNALDWFMRVARDADVKTPGKVRIRLCSSVEAFMLIVDGNVLFEPYHFGDEFNVSFPAQTPVQLAGNMPLLEFHTPNPAPFPPRHGMNIRSPIDVCVSHFNRVFEHFSVDPPMDLFDP